jgi:hypothetical protein
MMGLLVGIVMGLPVGITNKLHAEHIEIEKIEEDLQ